MTSCLPPSSEKPQSICLSNVVLTCTYSTLLDLPTVAWALSAEYNPAVFAAAQLRLLQPASTALIFASGRLVITGSRSESAALTSVYIYTRLIRQAVQVPLRITSVNIQNLVASTDVGHYIKIDELSRHLMLSTIYDASLFPGLRLKIPDPPMKALLFLRGKIVLTGAKQRSDIVRAWAIIKSIVQPFLTDKPLLHVDITSAKHASKKLTIVDAEDVMLEDEPGVADFQFF
jgi:transcription initiation factor TFIID TATA-box-binding protein